MNESYTSPFNIEMREVGVWWDIEQNIPDLESALKLASSYANQFDNDERVRIVDKDGKII
jgi:hypothetical protein